MSEIKTKAHLLLELQEAQLSGNAETIAANKSDKHEIAAAEKDYVHVELVTRTNNPATQSYEETSRVVAYRPEEFESIKKTGTLDGYYSQAIIHDPRSKAQIKAVGEGAGTDKAPAPKNKAEWQARYKEVIGNAPEDTLTVAQLQEAVEAKESEGK